MSCQPPACTTHSYFGVLGSLVLLVGVSCTAQTGAPAPGASDRPALVPKPSSSVSGDAAFLEMVRTYEGIAHYEDSSTTNWRFVSHNDSKVTSQVIQSELVFERPARMLLRYWVNDERLPSWGALWWSDSEVHSQRRFEPTRRKWNSIHEAAGALSGVSNGLTNTVPLLLIGRHPWSCREERPTFEALGSEAIGSVHCSKLRVLRPPCPPVVLWIAETSHLLLKMETRRNISEEASKTYSGQFAAVLPSDVSPEFRDRVASSGAAATVEQTTLFQPRVGIKIDATRFMVLEHADSAAP